MSTLRCLRGVAGVPVLGVLTLLPPCLAQDRALRFGRLSVEQGLSNVWVQAIVKDSDGFLWFGTQDGLNRYDGGGVRIYRHDPEDPSSLPSSIVGALLEDGKKRLWVGSGWGNAGLALYDRERDAFTRIDVSAGRPGTNNVRALAEDGRGQIWLATDNGLARLDPERMTVERFPLLDDSLAGDPAAIVQSLLCDRQDRIWVGTTAGLLQFDRQSGEYVRWPDGGQGPRDLAHAEVWDLYEDEGGRLWIATLGDGLHHLDVSTGRDERFLPDAHDPHSISRAGVTRIEPDGRGSLYIGTDQGGLNVLDLQTKKFERYMSDPEDDGTLSSNTIWALHVDDQNLLWIGTFHGGVNVLSPARQRFGRIRANRGALPIPHVTAVLEDHRGDLWIGTDGGGLSRRDARTGAFTHLQHDPQDPTTIGSDAIWALLEDSQRKIWIGGWDCGLGLLDPSSGRVTRFRHDPGDPASLTSNHVWRIVELHTGELLVATHEGADLFDRVSRKFTKLTTIYPGAGQGVIYSAAEDAAGGVWLVGSVFAGRVDRGSGVVTRYQNDPRDPDSLGRGWAQAVFVDSVGNVWIGTDDGLSFLAVGRERLERFSTQDGLPSNTITSIQEDEAGNLWLATSRGISKLVGATSVPDSPRFLNFDVHDGLQGSEFTRNASLRGRDGVMYFGGSRGLSWFDPERIQQNAHLPRVVLTDLKIHNRSAGIGTPGSPLTKAITRTETLTLSHQHSMVTFEFAALDFAIPQKNQYAYKLEGFDTEWNHVGEQRTATYASLPPGRYTLRVKAANNDGVWNEAGVSLPITVLPPFYRALWFRLLLLLAGAVTLGFAYRLRTSRIQRRASDLAAMVEERTRDLNSANAELAGLNQQLEGRVQARTVELEAEKERLAVTLRSIGDGVIATDVEGRIVLLNRVAEEITGWSPAEAQARNLREVMPLVDRGTRDPLPDPVSVALKQGAVLDLPTTATLVRRDGREVLIADSAAPIRDRQSCVVGVVLVFRDVTERRRIEEELQNAQRLESLGVLAGGIAHDFNNLLTGIFGLLDLARMRSPADAPARGPLDRAFAVLARARGLTGQLLTFSHHGRPVTGPVSLGPLLESSVQFALSGSNVSCSLEIAADLWPVDGDEPQIDQVIDNLLLNARQAMPGGGTVIVQAVNVRAPEDVQAPIAPGRYVRITVRDQGEGVPPGLRSRIFEPFFTTKPAGSGLGLATSYSIVRRHGGHIELSSGQGEGATFVVLLPASSRTPAPGSQGERAPEQGHGRVLFVDDEDYVREVASALLEELGYTVETAADGGAAVEACRRAVAEGRPFDVAILDLTVPGGLGGVATAPLLRGVDASLPMIASSGYSEDPVMANGPAYGFVATLHKPFTAEELGAQLARVVVTRRGGPRS